MGLGDLGLSLLYPIDECDRFAEAAREMPRPPLEGCGTPEVVWVEMPASSEVHMEEGLGGLEPAESRRVDLRRITWTG